MTETEKKYWSEYKKKRQTEIEDVFRQVRTYYSCAIDALREFAKYEGRAQAMLDSAKHLTASKCDDYYELLENPDYFWKDGEKIPD